MRSTFMILVALFCFCSLVTQAVAEEAVSPHYGKHELLKDTSVGTWSIHGVTDGVEVTGQLKGDWAEGKECVVFSGYIQMKGGNAKTYLSGISGWDAATGKIKELLFSSDGSCGTALFDVKGNEIVGVREGVDAKGNKYTQKLSVTVGKNRWVGHPSNNCDANGKVITKHGEWVFTRQ